MCPINYSTWIMEKYKNFVIYGAGRTGSHWVEALLIGLFNTAHYRNGNFCVFPDHWIYHTNNIDELIAIPREIRDSVTLIVCDRANAFDREISYIVAKETTEFFEYSDKTITPFRVKPEYFKQSLVDCSFTQNRLNRAVVRKYKRVIRIDYDTLSSALVPEQYIADQLGVDYWVNLDYHHNSIKNPRNYKDLILNWEDLHQLYQEWLVDQ